MGIEPTSGNPQVFESTHRSPSMKRNPSAYSDRLAARHKALNPKYNFGVDASVNEA